MNIMTPAAGMTAEIQQKITEQVQARFFIKTDLLIARRIYASPTKVDLATLSAFVNEGLFPKLSPNYIAQRCTIIHEEMLEAFQDDQTVLPHLLTLTYDGGVEQSIPAKTNRRSAAVNAAPVAKPAPAQHFTSRAAPSKKAKAMKLPRTRQISHGSVKDPADVSPLVKKDYLREGEAYLALFNWLTTHKPDIKTGWSAKSRAALIIHLLIDPATPDYPQGIEELGDRVDLASDSVKTMMSGTRTVIRNGMSFNQDVMGIIDAKAPYTPRP